MSEWKKINEATFSLPKKEGMLVEGLVFCNEKTLDDPSMQEALKQVRNVATLEGIVGHSIAMPDMHWGYGFPIGGVAAMDMEKGVISPGGVGYDINCGVRLAILSQPLAKLPHKEKLLDTLFQLIPSGIGQGGRENLSEKDYDELTKKGAAWSIQKGFGLHEDLDYTESRGILSGGDAHLVSPLAKRRGSKQMGSIGSGNHFVEIGAVEKIFDEETARLWKIDIGATYILIHTGSRGFGHQICQDTLDTFMHLAFNKHLVDRQLVFAPIQSHHGQNYLKQMASAANFAFNNRQRILHYVREAFHKMYGFPHQDIRLLYDVCHNIAKIEEHEVHGKMRPLVVHRKGATRAFGKGAKELNPLYQKTGQPVLVPGDMGRGSFIMVGLGNPLSFCSACHGAGRAKSRIQSTKYWKGKDPILAMKAFQVSVRAHSKGTIIEEMPDAYKEIDEVAEITEKAGLAKKVAKLKPAFVLKG